MDRRLFVRLGAASLTAAATTVQPGSAEPSTLQDFKGVAVFDQNPRGRIIVADSLSYLSQRLDLMGSLTIAPQDVVLGSSFAGRQTFPVPLSLGARAIIAHAAGVGKDQAGIAGLAMAQGYGVPAAAAETMSARMSDGRSLLFEGRIGHVNQAASAAGVKVGMSVRDAAYALLTAPAGKKREIAAEGGSHTDGKITEMVKTAKGAIYATWFIALVKGAHPNDVYVTATHCAMTMAQYAITVKPKGIFANDAGMCKDRSGVVGLSILEKEGIPAAAVAAMSARIGDEMSSYNDGVISEVNAPAAKKGIKSGMRCKDAARLLLDA